MEIERKFIIKEKEKEYPCPFNIKELKKEIKSKGKTIIQNYVPTEFLPEIEKQLNFRLKFKPNEIRVRKIENKYFLTIKSKGKLKREEFEKRITKELFDLYSEFKINSIEKRRLVKIYKNQKLEIDYLPKKSLITCEIEFKSKKDAEKFKINMKEITGILKYRNRKLSKE